jgi:hypothetical protein
VLQLESAAVITTRFMMLAAYGIPMPEKTLRIC